MRSTITVVECDSCHTDRPADRTWAHIKRLDLDLCPECLKALWADVEKEHRRVIHGQVPSRRGGYRQLGEYDG